MYTFRPLKEVEIDALKHFLIQHSIDQAAVLLNLHHTLILVINQQIEGVITGKYSSETNFEITCVYITPHNRNQQFGEGIIKAYLNLLDLRGAKTVSYCGKLSAFFERINFIRSGQSVVAKLPDYFNTACHSKVSVNSID